jgi:hypothetical protein
MKITVGFLLATLFFLFNRCTSSRVGNMEILEQKFIIVDSFFIGGDGGHVKNKDVGYLIRNPVRSKDKLRKEVINFIAKHKDSSIVNYDNYVITFFLEDSVYNVPSLLKDIKPLYFFSNNTVCEVHWRSGGEPLLRIFNRSEIVLSERCKELTQ